MTLKKIVIHWTAGGNYPNSRDKHHYHFLIDKNGNVHNGEFQPEDNVNCYDGKYAAHTGGGNTGAIGITVCGMAGFKNFDKPGKYLLTAVQCEAMFNFTAGLCRKYKIPVTPERVFTHYEFGIKHPETSSRGKIDIVYLSPYPHVEKEKVGNFIRNKVQWYLNKQIRKEKQC